MKWVALFGIGLQVVGLAVAIVGVAESYRTVVERSLWRDVMADVAAWFVRRILRRRRPVTVHARTATLEAHVGMAAVSHGLPQPPDEASSIDERVDYLTQIVAILDDELLRARADAKQDVQAAEKRLGDNIDKVLQQVTETSNEVRTLRHASFGRDGSWPAQDGSRSRDHVARGDPDDRRFVLVTVWFPGDSVGRGLGKPLVRGIVEAISSRPLRQRMARWPLRHVSVRTVDS